MIDAARASIALGLSIVGGIPVTMAWTRLLHYRLRIEYPENFTQYHSDRLISFVVGVVERGIITMLAIWLPQSVGAIVAALLAVKAVGSWTGDNTSNPHRVRFFTALLGSLMSMGWALAFGIWAVA
jgi:hypothetical protein